MIRKLASWLTLVATVLVPAVTIADVIVTDNLTIQRNTTPYPLLTFHQTETLGSMAQSIADVLPIPRLSTVLPAATPEAIWKLQGAPPEFLLTEFAVSDNPQLWVKNDHPYRMHFYRRNASGPNPVEGLMGLNTDIPVAPLHVVCPNVAGAEAIAGFSIGSSPPINFRVLNASAGDGVFIPKIHGNSPSTNEALNLEGVVASNAGTAPALVFNAIKPGGGAIVNRPLVVFRNANVAKVTISPNGDMTATSFNPVSSRKLKHNIVDLSSQLAAEALEKLNPVEFVYKEDADHKRLGFIAEDVPDLVAAPDRKSVPLMDTVAVVTKAVKDHQQSLQDQKTSVARQDEQLDSQQKSIGRQKQVLDSQSKVINEQTKLIDGQTASLNDLLTRLDALEKKLEATK